jgi:hypothetical protein
LKVISIFNIGFPFTIIHALTPILHHLQTYYNENA